MKKWEMIEKEFARLHIPAVIDNDRNYFRVVRMNKIYKMSLEECAQYIKEIKQRPGLK